MFPEDLIVTDTNKEDMFDLKSDYPCCIREVTESGKNRSSHGIGIGYGIDKLHDCIVRKFP